MVVKPKYPFKLQLKSIYVSKEHSLEQTKDRIARALGLTSDAARLWRFEYPFASSYSTTPTAAEKIADYLARQLGQQKYSAEVLPDLQTETGPIQQNSGLVFPGHSLEVVLGKKIKEINTKNNGRLCTLD